MPQRTDRIPALGEDSDEILTSLGFSAMEIEQLHARGVIGAASSHH
jgi:crotonobetainyl-CoA:carnitine CoA-transferase CaiB-like acyl-CoA transferase